MIYSETMYELGSRPLAIRELAEYGKRRIAEVGAENVYDFSIGNPSVPAPDCVRETVEALLNEGDGVAVHSYTSAQGDPNTRKVIAAQINEAHGTHFGAEDLYLTSGASSALAILFEAMTASGEDEYILLAPYFPEYRTFVRHAGAKPVVVPPDTVRFQIDMDELESRITPHTRAVVVNSPNNPSGSVYSEETIRRLAALLEMKSKEFGTHIFILSDEPYREVVYDGAVVPYITKYYADTVVCYSYSKTLSLPGERIGYILVPKECYESRELYDAVCGAGRASGHVCASSLFQKVIARCAGMTSDIDAYRRNRDLLYGGLIEMGYECVKPEGAFYLFVKTLEPDTDAFCERAKAQDLLLVAGDDFGCPGYVRISYCVDHEMIRRSLPAFRRLKESYDK